MTHTLAHDRRQEAIETALDDNDNLADLASLIRDLKHCIVQAERWHAANPTNERYHFDASGLVETLENVEVVHERVEEDAANDANERFLERTRRAM